uniref:WGS project CAEQ00000000 data, annotated contig 895 n=1 Tax=Trypanosoma congolense (strain IL3000) TaxID=1068625 RepID=F9WJB8_TRYCI|nr:unnamed protein product [Trypanosoma congolense IL3000]
MSTATTYPDGKPILKHELVILDAGLATSLSRVDRNNFFSLFAAVACGDGALGADLMIDRLPPERRALQSKADRDKLRADMTEIFNIVSPGKSGGFRLRDISLGGMLQKVMSALRSNSTPLDGNFASLVLTVIVAEGLGKKLTPDFNLFAESAPYLVELLEDSELCFLAEKLRSLYGAKALLWNSLDFVKLERTPTYVEVVLRKISRTTDRAIQWFATRSATSNVS